MKGGKKLFIVGLILFFIFGLFTFAPSSLAQEPTTTPAGGGEADSSEEDVSAVPPPTQGAGGGDFLGTFLSGDALSENNILSAANKPKYGWVETMWLIVRQLVNFAITIFFFIAAASNILNIKVAEYGVKKTLPSVLIAGVLANFSYAISEAAITINEVFTQAFVGTGSSPTQTLNTFKGLVTTPLAQMKAGLDGSAAQNVSAFFGLIVIGIIALALILLFILFYVRNIVLAMLVVLAPLAFIAMAFPATQSVYSKWLSEAGKWVFLPAIASFWLFLGAFALSAGIASGGVWVAMLFAGLVAFMALKTPFMMGAFVGTVAGFVAAKAKPLGTYAAFATPGVGHGIRGYNQLQKLSQARINKVVNGPVFSRKTKPLSPFDPDEKVTGTQRFGRMYEWTKYAMATGFGATQRINGALYRAEGRVNEATSIDDRERKLLVDEGVEQVNKMQQTRIGEISILEENLQKRMSSLKDQAVESVLSTNKIIRAEKELARQREEITKRQRLITESKLTMEGMKPGEVVHQQVAEELDDLVKSYGYKTLAEVYTKQGSEASGAQGAVESMIEKQNYEGARRTVANSNIINTLTANKGFNAVDGAVDNFVTNSSDDQIIELQAYLEERMQHQGLGDLVTRINTDTDAQGNTIVTDTAQAREALRENMSALKGVGHYSSNENDRNGFQVSGDVMQRVSRAKLIEGELFKKAMGATGQGNAKVIEVQRDYRTSDQRHEDLLGQIKADTDAEKEALLNEYIGEFLNGNTKIGAYRGITDPTDHHAMTAFLQSNFRATYEGARNTNSDTLQSDARRLAIWISRSDTSNQAAIDASVDILTRVEELELAQNTPGVTGQDLQGYRTALANAVSNQAIRSAIGFTGEASAHGQLGT